MARRARAPCRRSRGLRLERYPIQLNQFDGGGTRDGGLKPAATKAGTRPASQTANAVSAALHDAVQHHLAGRLDQAETLYRRILRSHPEQPDALHLLGVVAHQRGQNAAAEALIRNAIRLSPRVPDYHNNLGNALQAQGKPAEAEDSYRRALGLC